MLIGPYSDNRTNFTGITKKLKHHIFIDGKKDICELLNLTKPKNTYVGQLPPVLFYALPKEERPKAILDIYKIFDGVANEIRSFKTCNAQTSHERNNLRPDSTVTRLKNLFVKYGILKPSDNFDIQYIGAGEYKKAFKLEGVKDPKSGEELCLKVFHVIDRTPEWHKYKSHGVDAELNISINWRAKHGTDTQRGKFYWGDINNGYFVDKFIDNKVNKPKILINEYDEGLKLTDEGVYDTCHNKLHGYSIDPGGVRVVNRVKNESKTAQWVLKRIKNTEKKYRPIEWARIFRYQKKGINERQKEAGLALCIKHLKDKEYYLNLCLDFNNPFADQGIAYALKYLPEDMALKYFEVLMKRKHPKTQTVLMNEIPLLSRERLKKDSIDDLDVPKGEINSERLEKFYRIAEKYVLTEVEEHLASYMHLLPAKNIMSEADKLIAKDDYNVFDRLLHKIKFVKDEEYSFSDKMEVLSKLDKVVTDDFLKNKIKMVRTQIIRNTLED